MLRDSALGRAEALVLPRLPVAWRRPLFLLGLAWLALVALSTADWVAMALQWWDVSTYNHILLIPLILVWLVRLRAPLLASLAPAAWWPGIALLAGTLLLWLLGTVAAVNSVSQLGAVLALQAAVVALLGPRVAAALLFPLAYMLFLVPFGDELVPLLQTVTAELTIALTQWSGVPAEIDGVFIDTPVGLFEVAEACSGVKFLIAMVALGTLVAHVCFRRWKRRALFMAAAIVLPILANGVRAWGTIYLAQSQGIEFAEGFDHIFYGWIFFALVMAVLLGGSWRWFDRAPEDTAPEVSPLASSPLLARLERGAADGRRVLMAIVLTVLVFSVWATGARALEATLPARIDLPQVPGWQRTDYTPAVWWEPRAAGADHRLLGRYRDANGHEVDVFFALYAGEAQGSEAGAQGEGALVPDTSWRWLAAAPPVASGDAQWLLGANRTKRLAATWYRSGNLITGSRSRLKLAALSDRLAMQTRPIATLILSAEAGEGTDPSAALTAFLAATGSPDAWMDGIAQVP